MTTKTSAIAKKAKPGETILITGAAGCVGHIMVDNLLKKGYKLVLTDLPTSNMPVEESDDVKIIKGDLTEDSLIKELVKGVDHVINLAAWVDIGKSFEELAPINLYAVQKLYRAATEKKVKRFIHYSTGSMYAEHYGPIHEEFPVHPENGYARTKYMADDFMLSQPDSGPKITIIRPALIFGPRGKVLAATLATMPPIIKMLTDKTMRINGGPKSNWVHAQDMVGGTIHLLEMDLANKEIFNIANEEATTAGDAFNHAMEADGITLQTPAIPFPKNIIDIFMPIIALETNFAITNKILGMLWEKVVKDNGLSDELKPSVDKEAMAFTVHDMIFDVSKIKNTGYKLVYPDFRSGWEATVKWYRDNKWIP